MRPRALVAVATAFVLAGCSFVYASDLDAAHRASGPELDGAPGNTIGPDGALVSPAADGGATDGAVSTEAGPPTGCAALNPAPKYCDDFDGDAAIDDGWNFYVQQGGPVAYDTSLFLSPPRSAKVTFSTTRDCQYSRLEKSFANIGSGRAELHVRMRPLSPWTNLTPLVFSLKDEQTPAECDALLYVNSNQGGQISQLQVNMQMSAQANDVRDLDGLTPSGIWTKIDIVATPIQSGVSGGGSHYQFTFTPDGQAPVVNELDFTQCPSWSAAEVDLGIHCSSGQGILNYDDLSLDWQ